MVPLRTLLALCALAFVADGALAQPAPGAEPARRAADGAVDRDAAEPPRPGDVVRLRIWREPDMSGDFPVEEDGRVVLPKLGAVQVGDRSRDAVKRDLVAAYVRMLSHESVAVTVMRRIQVTGAVRNPGLYPLDPTITVEEAVTVAGGATQEGRTDRVQLLRGGQRVVVRLDRDTRLADSPVRSGDQLFVPQRNWLSRNSLVAASIVSVLGSVLVLSIR